MHEPAVVLLFHYFIHCLSAEEHALYIKRLHSVPVLKRDLVNARGAGDAGIVDPDVNPAVNLAQSKNIVAQVVKIGNVKAAELGVLPLGSDRSGDRFALFGIYVGDYDRCAEIGKTACYRLADALTGAPVSAVSLPGFGVAVLCTTGTLAE